MNVEESIAYVADHQPAGYTVRMFDATPDWMIDDPNQADSPSMYAEKEHAGQRHWVSILMGVSSRSAADGWYAEHLDVMITMACQMLDKRIAAAQS